MATIKQDSNGSYYCEFAPSIKIASGTGKGNLRYDAKRYVEGTANAIHTLLRDNWVAYGIINELNLMSGYEVIVTPMAAVCNASCAGTPEWTSSTQVQVKYLPYMWGPGGSCPGIGSNPDEVLLHELIHGYRQLKRRRFETSVDTPGFRYDNWEEFFAILLTNIYMSVRNRKLRKDHWGFEELYTGLANSRDFFKVHRHIQLVQFVVQQEPYFCKAFARNEQTDFNPVAYYMANEAELQARLHPPAKPAANSPLDDEADRLLREQINIFQRQQKLRTPATP